MNTIILSIFFTTAVPLVSGQDIKPEGPEIEKLSFKIGVWQWQAKGLVAPGDPNVYSGTGYSKVYYANDSTSIIDEHKIEWENGTKYKAITYRTYDPESKKYMVAWVQANSSNFSEIEGSWEGEKFVETESGTDSYGKWTNRLEIFNIQPDSHSAKLVRTYANGFKLTILEYDAIRVQETK